MEKELFLEKINEGYTIRKLCVFFNLTYGQIKYKLKNYGLKTSFYKKDNVWNKEDILDAISKSECKSDVLRNLNISTKSGNFQTLDKYCLKYDIDISRLKYKNNRGNKFKRILVNEDIFIVDSLVSKETLKRRILEGNLLEYKCSGENCNIINTWIGKEIKLQLDHKNGVNNDNRLENLRYLCPNCHSQTNTYCIGAKKIGEINERKQIKKCGKKKLTDEKNINNGLTNAQIKQLFNLRKIERPQYEELLLEIKELGYTGTGRKYGVSDNSIRKWIKYYEKYGSLNNLTT